MPTQETTNMIELRHFFVTPGVAAAHALSGLAIFAGAESVLKTTPLLQDFTSAGTSWGIATDAAGTSATRTPIIDRDWVLAMLRLS